MARNQGKTLEAWLRSKALAAGLVPRRLEIERDFATNCFRIRGFDREGERKVMVVPEYELERLDFWDERRLQEETQYQLQVAQRKMQAEMEREMASMYNNTTANWITTGTSTGSATTNTIWYDQGLGQQYRQQQLGGQFLSGSRFFSGGGSIATRKKPKDFREELQQELDDYLKDVLH